MEDEIRQLREANKEKDKDEIRQLRETNREKDTEVMSVFRSDIVATCASLVYILLLTILYTRVAERFA